MEHLVALLQTYGIPPAQAVQLAKQMLTGGGQAGFGSPPPGGTPGFGNQPRDLDAGTIYFQKPHYAHDAKGEYGRGTVSTKRTTDSDLQDFKNEIAAFYASQRPARPPGGTQANGRLQ